MKAAIYARYSTDMQDRESITAQFRNCELRAKREGWSVVARYADEGISGNVYMRERPEGARLLADAEAKRFDILLVDDLSRAFRNQADQSQTLELLQYRGVHVVGVSDGVDTRQEDYEITLGAHGMINAQQRKKIGKHVHRQLSEKAAEGKNAGGCPYGYRVVYEAVTDAKGRVESKPVRREKHPATAKWVRFIFEKYAEGNAPRWIADELNRLKVPSPGSTWKRKVRTCKGWMGSAIVVILANPLYIGRQIWNRTKWVDVPQVERTRTGHKGRKKPEARPESEWIVTEQKQLRIIDNPLWERVQARKRERAPVSQLKHPDAHPRQKYLFSGLLTCAACGSKYVISDGYRYGCASNVNGGDHLCRNTVKVSRRLVEDKLLEGIKRDLFTPEAVAEFRRETARSLAERRRTQKPNTAALHRQLAQVEKEIARMVVAIKAGAFSDTLKAELEKAETLRKDLQARLNTDTQQEDKVLTFLPRAVDRYRALVADLVTVSQRDVARARAQIKTLLGGPIKLKPVPEGYLVAELAGDYAGLVKLASGNASINMVGSGGRI